MKDLSSAWDCGFLFDLNADKFLFIYFLFGGVRLNPH
jgi:hypothetical protein